MRPALGLLAALSLLVCSSVSLAAGAPIAQATKEQWSAAQTTFKVGDDLYDAGRHAEAITAYRASYEIVASPNSRLMIARALREQGQLAEAHAEFDATLREARAAAESEAKYASTVAAAETEQKALESKLAAVVLKPPSGVELKSVMLNGRAVAEEDIGRPIFVMPGAVKVEAQASDGRELSRELSASPGAPHELSLEFPAPISRQPKAPIPPVRPRESGGSPLRTSSYVAAGVGAAGLAMFGVFGALNNGKHGDLEDSCPDDRCGAASQEDIDAGRRYQLLANIGLAVGVVGVGAGVTLFVLSSHGSEPAAAAAPRPPAPRWAVGVGPASLRVKGQF